MALLKELLKRNLHILAAKFGQHTRTSKQPELLILMYHRVLPLEDSRTNLEEPGMVVTPETFHQNLTTLAKYFDFVSLSDWLEKKKNNQPLPLKACAITFDDGWADNYEYAFPILHNLNIPATIFLVSEMIGTTNMFWPERLARTIKVIASEHPEYWSHPDTQWLQARNPDYQFDSTTPNREQLSRIINNTKHFSDHEIHEHLDKLHESLNIIITPEQAPLLSWEQVTELEASGIIEFGSHTCQHTRLNNSTPADITEHEIINSKKQIKNRTANTIKTFCFPNGDHSNLALEFVQQNYLGAVTTQSGWNTNKSDTHLLQRIGIHEDIAHDKISFLARISGWF